MTQNIHIFPTILDLDERKFHLEALRLLDIVAADFEPNILVGIRSGGYFLAEAMVAQSVPDAFALVSVTRRRGSTQSKKRLKLKKILGHAPRPVKNGLRLLEHRIMMALATTKPVEPVVPDPDEANQFQRILAALDGPPRILIVDDAVDSGATLLAVLDYVRATAGITADIRSAVITVTHPKPLIQPDYALYRDVLCRFYWSSDFA